MSKNEQLPLTTGDKVLFDEFFAQDLAFAERSPLRAVALQAIAKNLNCANASALADGLEAVAKGYVLIEHSGRLTGELTKICGLLTNFETVDIHQATYLCAAFIQGDDPERVLPLILSQDPKLAWAISPLCRPETSNKLLCAWNRVADVSDDARDMLARAALRYSHPTYGSTIHESLQSLEAVMSARFALNVGDTVKIEGSQALVTPSSGTITEAIPLPLNEALFLGKYEGLVVHEQTNNGNQIARLCLALSVDSGDIVLQPCTAMRFTAAAPDVQ